MDELSFRFDGAPSSSTLPMPLIHRDSSQDRRIQEKGDPHPAALTITIGHNDTMSTIRTRRPLRVSTHERRGPAAARRGRSGDGLGRRVPPVPPQRGAMLALSYCTVEIDITSDPKLVLEEKNCVRAILRYRSHQYFRTRGSIILLLFT